MNQIFTYSQYPFGGVKGERSEFILTLDSPDEPYPFLVALLIRAPALQRGQGFGAATDPSGCLPSQIHLAGVW